MHIELPDYPGVLLVCNFEAAGFQKEDPDAMKDIKSLTRQYPGKVLRLGRRSLPDRPRKGREMCVSTKNETSKVNEYDFLLSFDSERPSNQPDIYFTMSTAGININGPKANTYPQAFIDDTEALELWDALIKTIRPYPGSV